MNRGMGSLVDGLHCFFLELAGSGYHFVAGGGSAAFNVEQVCSVGFARFFSFAFVCSEQFYELLLCSRFVY